MALNKIIFKPLAIKDLDSLDPLTARRIIKKIEWFCVRANPLVFAAKLTKPEIGQYRFRIGDYRVIFDYENKAAIILRIGHRSTIYK